MWAFNCRICGSAEIGSEIGNDLCDECASKPEEIAPSASPNKPSDDAIAKS